MENKEILGLIETENKRGRPSVFNNEVILALERAFLHGYTDEEACYLAGIEPRNLYNFQKRYPVVKEWKKKLKSKLNQKVRTNIANLIDKEDKDVTKWYADRKLPDFKPKQDIESEIPQTLIVNVIKPDGEGEEDNIVQADGKAISSVEEADGQDNA